MMQGSAESASPARQFGFTTDDLWSVLEGGPLAAPYAKVKLDTIKEGDFTPQMQLTGAEGRAAGAGRRRRSINAGHAAYCAAVAAGG